MRKKKTSIKKIIKIVSGIIIFLTLPTFLLFGFLYFKYNEELPTGIIGQQADSLAYKMLNALDHKKYEATDYIEFTFKKRHHYKWNKKEGTCEVFWKNYKVNLDLKDHSNSEVFQNDIKIDSPELIQKATDYFNNDTFWLVSPYKVFDAGTQRSLVTLENGKHALLITYTSGGSTPGDSYLWLLDDSNKPTSFKMWTSILPIQGLEASWSDWATTESGAQLPTFHKLLIFGLEMDDVIGKSLSLSEINCNKTKNKNEETDLETIIYKTCDFRRYTSISEGIPNRVGKYYWKYKILEKGIEIENTEMFNNNYQELEKIINDKLKEEYFLNSNNTSISDCMKLIKFRYYNLNEMGISFSQENIINFNIDYKTISACDNVGGSIQSFKISEIENYFSK